MAKTIYRALLIGNSQFPYDSHNLQSLEGPINDLAKLKGALTHPNAGLFAEEQVRLLPDRTASEILKEMNKFFAAATRDDCLLLYYSGHGLMERNDLFLCARDTESDLLMSTAVSSVRINEMIAAAVAHTTVIVLDCCHSGAHIYKGGNLPEMLRGEGRFVLTSCRGGELANDADRANGTSVFTQHLIDGLVTEAADTNGDGYVDLGELYEYVHAQLTAEGRQRPQRQFAGGGEVAIARRHGSAARTRALTRPAAAEPEVVAPSQAPNYVPKESFAEPNKGVLCIAFSRGGRWLVWSCGDGRCRLRDLALDRLLTLAGHTAPVWTVAFSPDGRCLASAGSDKTIRFWSTSSGELRQEPLEDRRRLLCIAFSPNGRLLATAGDGNSIDLLDADSGTRVHSLDGSQRLVHTLTFSPDGRLLAAAGSDKNINLWNTADWKPVKTLTRHQKAIFCVAFNGDGQRLASGSRDGRLVVWDTNSWEPVHTFRAHSHSVMSIAFDRRGRLLASGSGDGVIKLWDTLTGVQVEMIDSRQIAVHCLAFRRAGRLLASGGADESVRLWEPARVPRVFGPPRHDEREDLRTSRGE